MKRLMIISLLSCLVVQIQANSFSLSIDANQSMCSSVPGSTGWTSSQKWLAAAVAAAGIAGGLYYLYNRWFNPALAKRVEPNKQCESSIGNSNMPDFGDFDYSDAILTLDIDSLKITVERDFHGVKFFWGEYVLNADYVIHGKDVDAGEKVYSVEMHLGGAVRQLCDSDINSLINRVEGGFKKMSNVPQVSAADIKSFFSL